MTIDVAGGQLGGAARYRTELTGYLERHARRDVKVIGSRRRLSPAWLAAREASAVRRGRRIALNNVGFLTPGGERWTLLANALHFLDGHEAAALDPGLRAAMTRQARIVHRAARRSDVLIAPCTAMAERITATLPDVADRLLVRMHPVSALVRTPARRETSLILCPVLFAPYKHMAERIAEWLAAVDDVLDDSVRLIVTASATEVPASLAAEPAAALRRTAQRRPGEGPVACAAGPSTSRRALNRSAARLRRHGPAGGRSSPGTPRRTGRSPAPRCAATPWVTRDSLRHATEAAADRPDRSRPRAVRPGRVLRLDARGRPVTRLGLRPYRAGTSRRRGSVPVTVVVLTRDEEVNIARCLASVAWAEPGGRDRLRVDGRHGADRPVARRGRRGAALARVLRPAGVRAAASGGPARLGLLRRRRRVGLPGARVRNSDAAARDRTARPSPTASGWSS